MIKSGWKNI